MVSVPASEAGGRGFESHHPDMCPSKGCVSILGASTAVISMAKERERSERLPVWQNRERLPES